MGVTLPRLGQIYYDFDDSRTLQCTPILTCYMINCFWSFPHLFFHNAIALPVLKFIFNTVLVREVCVWKTNRHIHLLRASSLPCNVLSHDSHRTEATELYHVGRLWFLLKYHPFNMYGPTLGPQVLFHLTRAHTVHEWWIFKIVNPDPMWTILVCSGTSALPVVLQYRYILLHVRVCTTGFTVWKMLQDMAQTTPEGIWEP